MRFRRRVRLFPGVTLNFSKTGISTTVGVPGASLNFNKQGTFLNTGIPGTGIYDRKRVGGKTTPHSPASRNLSNNFLEDGNGMRGEQQPLAENLSTTTTEGLKRLQETLVNCYEEKNELIQEIKIAGSSLKWSKILLVISYFLIIGFFIKWFRNNRDEKMEYLADLEKQLAGCFVNIDMQTDIEIESAYTSLLSRYTSLLTCAKIWDITSFSPNNFPGSRSAATQTVTRVEVNFDFGNLEIIKSKYEALHFENANGGDLYVYPFFMAIVDSEKNFGLLDLREIDFEYSSQKFLEEEKIPEDAEITGKSWAKANKDGSPDRRFKENYQIPVCLYGNINIKSKTGLKEAYSFSNAAKARDFAKTLKIYQKLLQS
ncbi:DUF4236 domain-containing protein [Rhodonellum sp.]|uniref:DUF4236 domain-containing protein n=1 Tax=Rhodonellum sp. TaxID=2231180 RepID=UPI002717AA0C|nr:DUF4236 domain-containing protein [Rhodonellum sp.]MDO9551522.1 DUF4236 domain-containing protein [Rhodonellum sp.]